MKIEEHWEDGIVYEIEYTLEIGTKRKIIYDLICCIANIEESYVKKKLSKNIKVRLENCRCISIYELYDVLIDKKAVECNPNKQIKAASLFRISFSTCQKNEMRKIEKLILVEKKMSPSKVEKYIKHKFSNVEEVLTVQHIENMLTIV